MDDNKYVNSKEYFLIYGALIQAARCRGTLTYQDVAALMGLPLTGNHMGREAGNMIGIISQNEVEHGRPMLSAIVVSSTNHKPSEGFFGWASDLGRYQGQSEAEKWRFWESERQAVYETWQDDFATYQPRGK